jgi:hypothetical protein
MMRRCLARHTSATQAAQPTLSLLGVPVPSQVEGVLRPIIDHPYFAMAIGTLATVFYWHWQVALESERRLLQTQAAIIKITEGIVSDCHEKLKIADEKWAAAAKEQNDVLRELQMQNVEEWRIVDRLQNAIKLCGVTDADIVVPTVLGNVVNPFPVMGTKLKDRLSSATGDPNNDAVASTVAEPAGGRDPVASAAIPSPSE